MARKIRTGTIVKLVLSLLLIATIAGLGVGYYIYNTSLRPMTGISREISFTVEDNWTANDVIKELVKEGFIQNEFVAKVYVKLNKIDKIYAGNFTLNQNMSVPEIFDVLTDEDNAVIEQVELTIIPGDWCKDVAAKIAEVTDLKASDIMDRWNDVKYINELMGKYEFITEDCLASEHCYLEGYLAPETMYLYKNSSIEVITEKILDITNEMYMKYRDAIKASDYTVHQIFTLASMVQFEAKTPEDMKKVAGVFYNRLNDDWLLGSSVTVCYALYDDYKTWEDCERNPDIVSPYNTYVNQGLPIGPICNFNEAAMEATINPEITDYYYFIANVNTGDMYFAKTYEEHQYNIDHYMY
ncbi:MAG: endolytic transglycosylase MltG [Erysipelotrichaceae bacterium]|nr:endolytic transglycosylase MltG [Erysipelotrichaceae bacterium]